MAVNECWLSLPQEAHRRAANLGVRSQGSAGGGRSTSITWPGVHKSVTSLDAIAGRAYGTHGLGRSLRQLSHFVHQTFLWPLCSPLLLRGAFLNLSPRTCDTAPLPPTGCQLAILKEHLLLTHPPEFGKGRERPGADVGTLLQAHICLCFDRDLNTATGLQGAQEPAGAGCGGCGRPGAHAAARDEPAVLHAANRQLCHPGAHPNRHVPLSDWHAIIRLSSPPPATNLPSYMRPTANSVTRVRIQITTYSCPIGMQSSGCRRRRTQQTCRFKFDPLPTPSPGCACHVT